MQDSGFSPRAPAKNAGPRRHRLSCKEKVFFLHFTLSPLIKCAAFFPFYAPSRTIPPDFWQKKKAGKGERPSDPIQSGLFFTQTSPFVKSLKIALLHFYCRQSYGSSPQAHRPGTPAKASSAKLLFRPLTACRLRGGSSLLRLYQYYPHHNTLFPKKQRSGKK
ncbi:MAG: hypothetical protein HFK04_02105 [Oscillospiraceae bacterium]|nr:hypothetical protein [Oscillospiraceae bacterium]